MPFSAGPNIAARPNLVFEYDTGDVKNSYIGEPTTNLAPYSQDFSQWGGNLFGNWINSNVTLNNGYAPDGTFTANTFGNGYSRFTNSIAASTNTIYTFSVWLQNVSLTGAGVQLWYAFGLNGGLVSYANGLSVGVGTLTNQWQRFQFSVTSPSSGINQLQFGVAPFTGYGNNNSGQLVNVWGGQVEQKNHATQYLPTTTTTATRSNTQGLLDVSGYNRTISLSNVSFTSAAQMTFDGTDDYIPSIGTAIIPAGSIPYTVSVWVNRGRNNVGYEELLAQWTYANSSNSFFFGFNNSNVRFSDSWNDVSVSGAGNTNVWMNLVGVNTGANAYIYLNGALAATKGSALTYTGTGPLLMGRQGELSGEYFLGRMNNVQIYDSALSAQEVRRNYNQLKGRFNLS